MSIVLNGTGSITGLTSGAGIAAAALSGQVPDTNAPSGSVIQVVSTSTFISFSTSSTSYVDTGLSVTITPSAASSRIMLIYSGAWNIRAANTAIELAFVRDSTNLGKQSALYSATHSGYFTTPVACSHLDSPSSTSSIVYKIYAKEAGVAGTVGLADDVLHTFIAQEIAA